MLDFTDRESYLAYRAEWRNTYAGISLTIRALKNQRKQQSRDHDPQLYKTLSKLREMKRFATEMLEERAASKIQSAEQRLKEYA